MRAFICFAPRLIRAVSRQNAVEFRDGRFSGVDCRTDTVKSLRDGRAVFGYRNARIIAAGGGIYPPDQNFFSNHDHQPNTIPDFILWRRHGLSGVVSPARRRGAGGDHQQVLLPDLPLPAAVFRASHPRGLFQDGKLPAGRNGPPVGARNAALPENGSRPGDSPRRRPAGRSGMGSSSAFTVGLLHALVRAARGKSSGKNSWPAESIHLEQEILKETVGSQDQVCAAYGGVNRINFFQNGDFPCSR
jgi:hypothetical protein